MTMVEITEVLREASEAVERLAAGDDGMLAEGDTASAIAAMLAEAQSLAQLVEDETNRRFTRLDESEIEDVVDGWLDAAGKVAERRGE